MAHQQTIDAYNKIADEFKARNFKSIYEKEFEKLASMLPKGAKVIELGCGGGRDAAILIDKGFDYTGVDASVGMLEVARKVVPNGNFELMDFYKLDLPAKSFDGFVANASLLHVPKKEIAPVLAGIKTILKPGAIGFVSVQEKTELDEGLVKRPHYGELVRYFSYYDQEEFGEILINAGFAVLETTKAVEDDERKTVWLYYLVKNV